MRYILMILLCSFSFAVSAKTVKMEASKVALGQWHLGLGVGVGIAKNPLHGGDDFPLLLLPDIAYYDEHLYFDNGQLGYTFFDQQNHVVSLIAEFNPEKKFFVFWSPSNIFLKNTNSVTNKTKPVIENPEANSIDYNEIAKRKWALDSGINYQYFHERFIARVNVLTDISNIHNGWRVGVEFAHSFNIGNLIVQPIVGVWHKTAELNNYYYGLSKRDNVGIIYKLDSVWQPYAHLQLTYPLSQNKAVLLKLSYDDYSDTSNSPLFKYDYAVNIFMGLKYIF
ncbi:MipA/OmpV family protein [Pseudoalteromonas sp. NBT06-2]|uniref:MipA/OmpV family protein n=1 Tax=Pseudoalteromonas sp. NBT06-2 TaxID=2025950 RepID=UPI00148331DC|nr:MipA/OmpV family protein [Pseudoalteromonas sp. NBT06-2]